MSDQDVFILKNLGLHDEEVNKTNVSDLLTAAQRRLGHFLYFVMTVHPDQNDPYWNYIPMTCIACIQLTLDVGGIYSSIDTKIMVKPHILIVHLAALDNEGNPDINTLNKDRGDIFSECCAEGFKGNFYVMSMKYYFKWLKQP